MEHEENLVMLCSIAQCTKNFFYRRNPANFFFFNIGFVNTVSTAHLLFSRPYGLVYPPAGRVWSPQEIFIQCES